MILVRLKVHPESAEAFMGEAAGILLLACACLLVSALEFFGVIQ